MGFEDLRVKVIPHNLIYGTFKKNEKFNWTKKAEIAGRLSGFAFDEYPGGFDEFFAEAQRTLSDPRVFTYTPFVICRGRNPVR
jgi:hypothetical protein